MQQDNHKTEIAPVALRGCQSYQQAEVERVVQDLLSDLGGIGPLVAGKRVLIKPNFLLYKPPERAVNTHPEVIRAVATAVYAAGAARIQLADSPAVGKGSRVAKKLGLPALLEPLGVELVDFETPVQVDRPGGRGTIKLDRRVLDAEVLLNLAKLKSHGLCGLTLAVKNCFGAVGGLGKARWHMRCGRDVAAFAQMVVDVCRLVAPSLSLIDGIVGMDGNGPSAGRARPMGLLAASENPFALDRVVARVCGVRPEWVSTFGPDDFTDLESVSPLGTPPEALSVSNWQMPRRFTGRRLGPVPRFLHKRCDLCQQCVQVCQANALSVCSDRIAVDKRTCIRCYCCQEICPAEAIVLKRGLFG